MPITATVNKTNTAVDGVIGGVKWNAANLTYSFPTSASFYGSPYANGEAQTFAPLNEMQKAAARYAYAQVASFTNLSFTEITETSTNHATLRHALSDYPATAEGYYPSESASGGDAWYHKTGGPYGAPVKGSYAFGSGFLHEIGHTLGLKHPHAAENGFPILNPALDSSEFSVMSYKSFVGSTLGYMSNAAWDFPQTYMMLDIAGLQEMYGADFTFNNGNTLYGWNPNTGEMSINGVGQGAPGGNKIFMTVWDGGGNDTYDFSNYGATNLKIDLRPGEWSTLAVVQLADLDSASADPARIARGNIANALLYHGNQASLIEKAIGANGNDLIVGNQADNWLIGNYGDDILRGNEGNDLLDGGFGYDTLDGGAGVDTADYKFFDSATIVDLALGRVNFPGRDDGGRFDTLISIENAITGNANDILIGNSANNMLIANAGNDDLRGGDGNDLLDGGYGYDRLDGGNGVDTADYRFYDATIVADLNLGRVDFPGRNDGFGFDTLIAIENVIATNANDTLIGNGLANALYGQGGNDLLDGNGGRDVLFGGAGADAFLFDTALSAKLNKDTIMDFNAVEDTIQVDNAVFTRLDEGALARAEFRLGAKALDRNDHFIYDRADGDLIYDANGSGKGHAVLIAHFDNNVVLSFQDFLVV